MASLIDKIEMLIKREKKSPDKKVKEEPIKSSNEILSELFGAFNADPPKIEEVPPKKSKKSKKRHKKEKKKRSRSNSCGSDSDRSSYSPKKKKRKKSKSSKKRKERVVSRSSSHSPSPIKLPPAIKHEVKSENIKTEKIKDEPKQETKRQVSIKVQGKINSNLTIDTSNIPMPEEEPVEDLRIKLESKRQESDKESEKNKGKIQIKNLKFSAVFEETVKKAEEEARKKKEKHEDGELTDSSSESVKEEPINSEFPKTSDPGGILKKQEEHKKSVDEKHDRKSKSEHKSHTDKELETRERKRSRSRSKRSKSRSRRSQSRSRRSRSRSTHRRRRSTSRSRRRSRSRHDSKSKSRRSESSSHRRHSPRHRRRSSRSPGGVRLRDSEKKRLLEVARRNAINMLKNGAIPAGAAALPPHTRSQVMAAIQSGGKSVDELTDFCKHLSKKEALGELSSVSSNDDEGSENEDTLAFHHPFLVKEKAPIVLNIRGAAPLPIKTNPALVANKEELRLQFPVSSGSQHREKASEWVPVSPKKDNMQLVKLNAKPTTAIKPPVGIEKAAPLALPAPPVAPVDPVTTPAVPTTTTNKPPYLTNFTSGAQLTSVPLALPAPGPQAYPPGLDPPKIDVASIVSQKLSMIRKEQEENEITHNTLGFGWTKDIGTLGQFTGTTGANILTPRELASGTQAWAKKDQLVRAAPVEGGMGMRLLQKMGWQPGSGLGKEGTGTLQPLLLEVKLDTRGLQAKEETQNRNRGVKGRGCHAGGARRGAAGLTVAAGKHPVSLLGEYCSKHKLGPPEYNLCFECGPDHKKNFLFRVKVAGTEYQPAVASANKKQAKLDAAQLALQKLGIIT